MTIRELTAERTFVIDEGDKCHHQQQIRVQQSGSVIILRTWLDNSGNVFGGRNPSHYPNIESAQRARPETMKLVKELL